MHPAGTVPLSLAPILPPALRKWSEPLDPVLCRLLIPQRLSRSLAQARLRDTGGEFAARLLDALDIRYHVDDAPIPRAGPAVLVANHPYGFVEGLILASAVANIRDDFRIIANMLLGSIPEMRRRLILVNPFESADASRQNRAPIRESIDGLGSGGLLVIFPAGEVAHVDFKEQSIVDPPWKTTAARLALRLGCGVVPVFFEGANSLPFQLAGTLHPGLRTISLPRELDNLRGRTLRLRVGKEIPCAVLRELGGAERATAYLRARTYFLSCRSEAAPRPGPVRPRVIPARADESAPARLLSEEAAALPPECRLPGNAEFALYVANSTHIPNILQEVGRRRERAFREVGEGTGKESDLDRFDRHYQHLLLWHRKDDRLAGAYRLAVTSDVLPEHGAAGLYTSTLFRYHPEFLKRLGPAVELGRSFIVPEYQKSYAPLLLLWKGIARYVLRRPEAAVLFGAVSISARYNRVSRSLLATWLAGRALHELARFVRPRRRFRNPVARRGEIPRFVELISDIEDLAAPISELEPDGKSVPVLVRQYMRAGGRLLGFNVDPNFSDALDALIVVDLRNAPVPLLERLMGRSEAAQFLAACGRVASVTEPAMNCHRGETGRAIA